MPAATSCRSNARSAPAAGANVSMVYQEPGRALNPSILVGRQVAEVYEIAGVKHKEAIERAEQTLDQGADLQSRRGDEALPTPALRWTLNRP